MNGEFLSSILHLLPLIYPVFGPEYESNFDPDPQYCLKGQCHEKFVLNETVGF